MRRIFHILTWCYVIFLTLLLWLPDPQTVLYGWSPDEGTAGYAHIVTFALLAFLIELDRQKKSRFFWTTLLIAYVFLTEIVQEILPIRQFNFADIIQNLAGLTLGFYFAEIVNLVFKKYFTKR